MSASLGPLLREPLHAPPSTYLPIFLLLWCLQVSELYFRPHPCALLSSPLLCAHHGFSFSLSHHGPCPAFCSPFPVSTELMSQGEETSPHVQSQEKDSRRTLTDLAPKYSCPASLYFLPYPSPKKDEKKKTKTMESTKNRMAQRLALLQTCAQHPDDHKSPPNIDLQSESTTNRQVPQSNRLASPSPKACLTPELPSRDSSVCPFPNLSCSI